MRLLSALRRRALILTYHSDQRSQYASEDDQDLLDAKRNHLQPEPADCCDSAVMESWFGTLKTELGETFDSQRSSTTSGGRHSSIGYVSPAEFERPGLVREAA